jgi:hypothetical protein
VDWKEDKCREEDRLIQAVCLQHQLAACVNLCFGLLFLRCAAGNIFAFTVNISGKS